MVERLLKLLGDAKLSADDVKPQAARSKASDPPVPEHHESFLEELARKECLAFPCKEHNRTDDGPVQAAAMNPDAADDDTDNGDGNEANDETEDFLRERRQFHLLQWSSDDDDDFDSDSYMTEEELDNDNNNFNGIDNNDDLDSGDESLGPEDELDDESDHEHLAEYELGWADRTTMPALQPHQLEFLSGQHVHPITTLLVGLANSENEPLIRAAIDWNTIINCPDLPAFYPAAELDDPFGARLLQGTLRMDPTLETIEKILDSFPKSCVDMSGFFAACQFANPKTSRKVRHGGSRKFHPLLLNSQNKRSKLNSYGGNADDADYDGGYGSDDSDDVGEVVKLVMHRTIVARQSNNIEWGMVAFLGDARTSAAHTKELLMHNPEALIDPKHGAFGVSPLDRMVSGKFIHGDTKAWAEKLRLALRAASYVRVKKEQAEQEGGPMKEIVLPKGFFAPYSQFLRTVNSFLSLTDMSKDSLSTKQPQDLSLQSFYPYHELIRLLVSPTFCGAKFGLSGFLNTLEACTDSDPNAFLRPDNEGNLPLHVALSSECNTSLGIKGERRLIRYLLNLDSHAALCPENNGLGRLPLRMCIDNGWPVYDIIVEAAFACDDSVRLKTPHLPKDATYRFKDHIEQIMVINKPLLHDALGGGYHPRFGVHGARQLVKKIISRTSQNQSSQSCLQSCLRAFIDSQGRTALHVALEHKWPVYDILLQMNPTCLEARDPVRYGFFPFQIAACSFTQKLEHDCEETAEPDEDQELFETSMLFEVIRENPLCVSWNDSNSNPPSALVASPKKNPSTVTFSEPERERPVDSMALLALNEEDDAANQSDRKRRLSSRS
jgi:hypothetical protein